MAKYLANNLSIWSHWTSSSAEITELRTIKILFHLKFDPKRRTVEPLPIGAFHLRDFKRRNGDQRMHAPAQR